MPGKNKSTNRINIRNLPILLIGIGGGILYWFLESVIHAFIFGKGDLIGQIFTSDPHEIWTRLLLIIIIIIFGGYTQFVINRRKQDEERIKRINAELDQIFNTAADGMRVIDKDFNVIRRKKEKTAPGPLALSLLPLFVGRMVNFSALLKTSKTSPSA